MELGSTKMVLSCKPFSTYRVFSFTPEIYCTICKLFAVLGDFIKVSLVRYFSTSKIFKKMCFRSVPPYFKWLSHLSWFKYGNEALLINQWEGVDHIQCTRSNTTCPQDGHVILETYNFSEVSFSKANEELVLT